VHLKVLKVQVYLKVVKVQVYLKSTEGASVPVVLKVQVYLKVLGKSVLSLHAHVGSYVIIHAWGKAASVPRNDGINQITHHSH
jgi:hypothetical protein